uniref:Uncharacterized protein n=1 Tax=Aegilops tauschii subsp. strangulata TaxID=200361 RepID=A0A453PFZ3_AEGTS
QMPLCLPAVHRMMWWTLDLEFGGAEAEQLLILFYYQTNHRKGFGGRGIFLFFVVYDEAEVHFTGLMSRTNIPKRKQEKRSHGGKRWRSPNRAAAGEAPGALLQFIRARGASGQTNW